MQLMLKLDKMIKVISNPSGNTTDVVWREGLTANDAVRLAGRTVPAGSSVFINRKMAMLYGPINPIAGLAPALRDKIVDHIDSPLSDGSEVIIADIHEWNHKLD
jgi:hypothetical protein